MIQHSHRSSLTAVFGILSLLGLGACSSDDDEASSGQSTNPATGNSSPLVVLTENASLENSVHYLHVVADWPSTGQLDNNGLELGAPGVAQVHSGAIYIYRKTGKIERYKVDEKLNLNRDAVISFNELGIVDGYDPEAIYVSADTAFLIDEKTAQIVRWNPTTMRIDGSTPIDGSIAVRNGLKAQFQHGIASAGRLFTTANYRDWDKNIARPGASIAVFDANNPAATPKLVENSRCAPSVGIGTFRDTDGYVYVVGDGAQGFDMLANLKKSEFHQCVVRMKEDANELDPNFYVDLQEVTKSPAIYMAYPMTGNKLLVSLWAPDVGVQTVADPTSTDWFWKGPPYYEYAIVDLKAGTSTRVAGLPRAAMRGQKTLIVDGKNYVQLFREDKGTTVHRVDADGTVTQVLTNPSGTNVQYVGRL